MTWRIRLVMTSIALVICFFAITGRSSISSAGHDSFNVLAILALIYTLAAGFLFTACSISEERREGTFGLLYLTPLSSWDVIAGKLASTSLQGVFGLVAILPVLFLPLLAGGVTGQQLTRVVLVLLVTLFFSLSAGMFASASARSSRGALGMTGMLVIFPLACGWLGILLATVFSFVSEQEKKKRASIYWLISYALLIAFQMWMVALSGYALVGSPGQAFWASSNPAVTSIGFLASLAAVTVTAVFYLFSAALCTEWYRSAREIAVEKEESEHVDDIIFPGLRSKGRVREEPARWL
ncbi:MAG: ABC transporter permease subunit, partial [Limisphaerales bacterium]